MRALLVTCLIALPVHALAHDGHRDVGDAAVATGYVGGTGALFGLAGGVLGGLAGWGIGPRDCDEEDRHCGTAAALLSVAGFGAGLFYGIWKGGTWFDEAERYDGSYLGATLGVLVGGAVGGAAAQAVYDGSDKAGWSVGVGAALWLAGIAVGSGSGWLLFGEERGGGVALDLPMLTPVGEDGYGIGLGGRF